MKKLINSLNKLRKLLLYKVNVFFKNFSTSTYEAQSIRVSGSCFEIVFTEDNDKYTIFIPVDAVTQVLVKHLL